jgi:hypothetical protein
MTKKVSKKVKEKPKGELYHPPMVDPAAQVDKAGTEKRDAFYGLNATERKIVKTYMQRNELSQAKLFRKLVREHVINAQ